MTSPTNEVIQCWKAGRQILWRLLNAPLMYWIRTKFILYFGNSCLQVLLFSGVSTKKPCNSYCKLCLNFVMRRSY